MKRRHTLVEEGSVVSCGAWHLQHLNPKRHPQPRNDLGGCYHAGPHAVTLLELLRVDRRGGCMGCMS